MMANAGLQATLMRIMQWLPYLRFPLADSIIYLAQRVRVPDSPPCRHHFRPRRHVDPGRAISVLICIDR